MKQATVAEFQREFEHYRAIAQCEPVEVTEEGRADLVVLSVEEYRRLKRRDRRVTRASEMPDADFAMLNSIVIPAELKAFDHEMD